MILRVGTESHHAFDTRAVVPAAVEQHELVRGRQLRRIALEIPRADFTIGWLAERHDSRLARAEILDDAFDRAVFAGGVAAFDDHEDLVVARDDLFLQLDEFDLQALQRLLVFAFGVFSLIVSAVFALIAFKFRSSRSPTRTRSR